MGAPPKPALPGLSGRGPRCKTPRHAGRPRWTRAPARSSLTRYRSPDNMLMINNLNNCLFHNKSLHAGGRGPLRERLPDGDRLRAQHEQPLQGNRALSSWVLTVLHINNHKITGVTVLGAQPHPKHRQQRRRTHHPGTITSP